MAINRKQVISAHNPTVREVDVTSPLTVGNGELAFTADVTGMQSLCGEYEHALPLCTMSQWGWHTTPVSEEQYAYTLEDLVMTEYDWQGRKVYYPQHEQEGNREVYNWLRLNPHRLNLARIGFLYQGREIRKDKLSRIHQQLHLYEGILESHFFIDGTECHVKTMCSYEEDVLAFEIESKAIETGELTICVQFPYGSPEISASDWKKDDSHRTAVTGQTKRELFIERSLDKDSYYVRYQGSSEADFTYTNHQIVILPSEKQSFFQFQIGFAADLHVLKEAAAFAQDAVQSVETSAREGWQNFWEKGGIVSFQGSTDKRAAELERRIILSQYLMAVNSSGSCPPQETGLTCNSWYGKMHLEMYLWHCAWLPLWNHTDKLEKSVAWYQAHLPEARDNAARNGYKGARWPKMIAAQGIDCPSKIAPLLIWQQPHIIYMLEMAYSVCPSEEFLHRYWQLVQETAVFMADFAVYDKETDTYNLEPPIIPVQERYQADKTRNPAFEVEYWYEALRIAAIWGRRLHKEEAGVWEETAGKMAPLHEAHGCYQAHEWCDETFTKVAEDHPSMLGAMGLLPGSRVNPAVMEATYLKVLECWDYGSLWGWDFAMMAMTAVRLGQPDKAIDILLKDTPKNNYVISGNNNQTTRKDLPLYLPGNGSLLLAIPLMTAGYPGCTDKLPGFPDNGMWKVEYENISPFI